MQGVSRVAYGSVRQVRRGLRIAWNVLTVSETGRRYPERARQVLWTWLSSHHPDAPLTRAYGRLLHRRNRRLQVRHPEGLFTFFVRNPAQFAVLHDIALEWPPAMPMRLAAIGCSTGAELYSALWTIRSARPGLRVVGTGVDISDEALAAAQRARYPLTCRELRRLTPADIDELVHGGLFDRDVDALVVRPSVTCGSRWVQADAIGSSLADQLGLQDVVFVNNILCHYRDAESVT